MTVLQTISLGTPPQATDGDTARTAFTKVNSNVAVLNSQAALTSATPITQPQALTSQHIGKRININLSAAGAVSPPPANTCAADNVLHLRNTGTAIVTLPPAPGSGDTVALTQLNPGETALLDTDGVRAWTVLMRGRTNADNETVNGNCTVNGSETVVGTLDVAGTLTARSNLLLSPAKVIAGDFSNSTYAQRTAFQTSITNASTSVGSLPNGSGTASYYTAWSKSDPTNAAFLQVGVVDGAVASISAGATGTGTVVPLTLNVGGSEALRIIANRRLLVGKTTDDGVGSLQLSLGAITGCTQLSANAANNASDLVCSAGAAVSNGATLALRGASSAYNANGFEMYAGGAERMRCNLSGDVHVNETTNTWAGSYFSVRGDSNHWAVAAYAAGSSGAGAHVVRVDNVACAIASFYYQTSYIGGITTNSTSTTYATTSDYRLKEDVRALDGDYAVNVVQRGKPSTFVFKSDKTRQRVTGFIAHELQELIPEAVCGEKDAMQPNPMKADNNGPTVPDFVPKYQGVDAAKAVPILWAALKRAFERIEALENQP